MPTLTLTKNYADSTLLLADDFDVFLDELELFLNTTGLSSNNFLALGITGELKLLDNSISAAKLQSNALTTAKIDDESIDTAQINALAVTTAKLTDSCVTTAKINTGAVTNAKIAAANITTPKFSYTTNLHISQLADASAVEGANTRTYASITGNTEKTLGSSTVTTSGRPVHIWLSHKPMTLTATFTDVSVGSTLSADDGFSGLTGIDIVSTAATNSAVSSLGCIFTLNRDGTPIYSTKLQSHMNIINPNHAVTYPGCMQFIDQPAAGTYVYTVSIEGLANGTTGIHNVQLNVTEI